MFIIPRKKSSVKQIFRKTGITFAVTTSLTLFAYLPLEFRPQNSDGIKWDIDNQYPSSFFSDGKLVYRIITSGSHAVPNNDRIADFVNAFQTWEDVPTSRISFQRGADADSNVNTDSNWVLS